LIQISLNDSFRPKVGRLVDRNVFEVSAQRGIGLTLVGTVGNKGEYRLRSERFVIGSDPSNELVIDEPTVSRRHAEVIQRSGVFQIRDLGSTNGTFVNGKRVEAPIPIGAGDEIRFGGVRFYARVETQAQPARRRFLHAPVVVALLVALSALSYQFVKNWLVLLDGADTIAIHQTPIATPLAPPRLTAPLPAKRASVATPVQPKSTPVSVPSVAASVPTSASTTATSSQPSWLKLLNHYRELAHLHSIVEDPNLSRADRLHAEYLVRNFPDAIRSGTGFGANAHLEDPGRPGFSPQGVAAAKASDVDEWHQTSAGDLTIRPPSEELAPEWNIDRWMSAPLHRPAILSPLLKTVGYGMYCISDLCAACLDLSHGAEAPGVTSLTFSRPVEFPPPGSQVALRTLYLEWPDPRSSCPGYKSPSGVPITVQVGAWVPAKLDAFTLLRTDKTKAVLDACGFDSDSYLNPDPAQQALVREILHDFGMVVVIPRRPLERAASYQVTATVNGTKFAWSFSTPSTDCLTKPPPTVLRARHGRAPVKRDADGP
jgi:hypothetical protein